MTSSGWTRLTPDFSPEGVTWWFYREFPDGFGYARGGRCRSAREARKAIKRCWAESISEHDVFLRRPTHRLGRQGELIPLELP